MTSSRTFAKVLSIPSSGAYNPNRLRHLRGTSMHNLDCIIAQNSFLSSNINSAVNGRMSALPFKTCGSVTILCAGHSVSPGVRWRARRTTQNNSNSSRQHSWAFFKSLTTFFLRALLALPSFSYTVKNIFNLCIFMLRFFVWKPKFLKKQNS